MDGTTKIHASVGRHYRRKTTPTRGHKFET